MTVALTSIFGGGEATSYEKYHTFQNIKNFSALFINIVHFLIIDPAR